MVFNYAVNLFLIVYVIVQGATCGPSVEFSPKKVEFTLDVNATVDVTLSYQNGSDVWLHLNTSGDVEFHPQILFFPSSKQNGTITVKARGAGFATVFVSNSTPQIESQDRAFVQILAFHSESLQLFIVIVGWSYFVAWSISFYPQIIKNFLRKSVVGFNFDFLTLNTLGHASYLLFNAGLYFDPTVQGQYFAKHQHGVNPVQLNDVLFSIHAVFGTLVQCVQCCIYERGDQVISKVCRGIVVVVFLFLGTSVVISICDVITWLMLLNFFSYVKLGITFIKYCPQVYTNYSHKSTKGFSVGYAIFDFMGGSLSVLQMFMIAYNFDDWSSFTGDFTKLGLGVVSIIFDLIFMSQHFCVYRSQSPAMTEKEKEAAAYVNHAFADVTTHL